MENLLNNNASDIVSMVIQIAVGVISLIVAYATTKLPAKWKNEADAAILSAQAKMREALHSAAISGVEDGKRKGLTGAALVSFALRHVLNSVPDSVAGLAPSAKDIILSGPADLVVSRLPGPLKKVLETIVSSKIYQEVSTGPKEPEWRAPIIPTDDLPRLE